MHPAVELNHRLVEYRHQPIYALLNTIGAKHSMLHRDVLTLLYHFAKYAEGEILEIGAYIGGSTIALGLGVQQSDRPGRKVTTVEGGGQHLTHPTLPSDDILRDFKRNVAKRGVAETVTLIEGWSADKPVIKQVHARLTPGSVGLFVVDADGAVERDFQLYGDLLRPRCLLVVDDYFAPGSEKAQPTQLAVDRMIAEGRVESYGLYGFGTWVGRLTDGSER